jgi:RNA polymerase sigma-70 factor, ECF subfamily
MDSEGVLALYDRYARDLLGFFTRRTRDPHLALDLLSETFLAAFEHRDQCRAGSEGEAAAWLYRIAANQLAAHYRRGAIERRATERLVAALREPTAEEISAIERLADVDEPGALTDALARLSGDQRAAVRRTRRRSPARHGYGCTTAGCGRSSPLRPRRRPRVQ